MPWREASIVSQREEFVALASADGANISELCRRYGVSRPTGYKWLARHRTGGSLSDRSRRPRSTPARSEREVETAVIRVRDRHPAWGARKIRAVLRDRGADIPAVSTVHAILVRHGRVHPAEAAKHTPVKRFEHDRPNALWQMDFKGHVPLRRGGRCHPLTIVDDHSRFAVALKACSNEQEPTVRAQLTETFRLFGLPERILADNGPPWGVPRPGFERTRLSMWLLRLGVVVTHGRPRHPQTQGKSERFHRTLKSELLARTDLRDLATAQEAFDGWRAEYNLVRPHEACDLHPPVTRYRPSARAFPERLPELEFGPDDLVRRVRPDGYVQHARRSWFVSEALAGELVALRPSPLDGVLRVCYGPHPIATLDLRARRRRPPLAALAPDADADFL
jgi:transposase InsO family protein